MCVYAFCLRTIFSLLFRPGIFVRTALSGFTWKVIHSGWPGDAGGAGDAPFGAWSQTGRQSDFGLPSDVSVFADSVAVSQRS